MKEQRLLDQVIEAFRCLPGVGPKSAQRMLLHLLERDREGGRHLARILSEAIEKIGHCKFCRNLTETEVCEICSDVSRGSTTICVVESPTDVIAIEQSLSFRGQYFVLMGTLSPIDGRGPDEIGIDQLVRRCEAGIQEIILAVSSTVEGEATAHYIAEALKPLNVTISRLAQGIPLGGELEYVDGGTLSHAFEGRKSI
ncbi:MAG: recombination protein RecR [Gammaproteobacteria bacterium]|jgi:recombination protein RecR|nr:recombination protein RecR [Gammaproteobacteria bacterium]